MARIAGMLAACRRPHRAAAAGSLCLYVRLTARGCEERGLRVALLDPSRIPSLGRWARVTLTPRSLARWARLRTTRRARRRRPRRILMRLLRTRRRLSPPARRARMRRAAAAAARAAAAAAAATTRRTPSWAYPRCRRPCRRVRACGASPRGCCAGGRPWLRRCQWCLLPGSNQSSRRVRQGFAPSTLIIKAQRCHASAAYLLSVAPTLRSRWALEHACSHLPRAARLVVQRQGRRGVRLCIGLRSAHLRATRSRARRQHCGLEEEGGRRGGRR